MEVVGWDGIDPLPEPLLFHAAAENSFGESLYISGEPAIFWLEGRRAFMRHHRGDDEAPVQEARCWSFLFRYDGENWAAKVLSETSEVVLLELRAILAGWLGLVMEQREEFDLAKDSWTQAVFRVAVKVHGGSWALPVPGVSNSCWRGYPSSSV